MSGPAQAVHLPALDNTMGAMFIGVVLGAALWGLSVLQMWHYFSRFTKDPWYFQGLVIAVGITDTMHQILISHSMYTYLVSNFANPLILNDIVWSLVVEVLFEGFTALLVQLFFCFRIYRLSQRNIPLTVLCVALTLGNFSVLLAYTARAFTFPHLTELPKIKSLALSMNAMGAITDVVIAAAMCSLLHRSRSGFKESDTVINKLIVFVVNTGLLTSTCAIASFVSNLVWPDAFIYICFFFLIGRLYNNSLLAALNARRSVSFSRTTDTAEGSGRFEDESRIQRPGSVPLTGMTMKTFPGVQTQQQISIKIDEERMTDEDRESFSPV